MEKTAKITQSANPNIIKRNWYVVDAEGQTLGRLVTRIASVLKGKHRPYFSTNLDTGDYVIVLNSNKVRLTGNKWNDKEYIWHSLYPGGQKKLTAQKMNNRNGKAMIEWAVKGMLPKTKLGDQYFRKLFTYEGTEHPHAAQQPKPLI